MASRRRIHGLSIRYDRYNREYGVFFNNELLRTFRNERDAELYIQNLEERVKSRIPRRLSVRTKRDQVSEMESILGRAGYENPDRWARYFKREGFTPAELDFRLKTGQLSRKYQPSVRRDPELLDKIENYALEAGIARLTGNVDRALGIESQLERLMISAERKGLANQAMEAEERGRRNAHKKVYGRRTRRDLVGFVSNVASNVVGNAAWDYYKNRRRTRRDPQPRGFKVCPVGTQIQTVILSKNYFTSRNAESWIRRHGFDLRKIDETNETFRFRQQNPNNFDEDSFRTISLRPGVKAVIGCPI